MPHTRRYIFNTLAMVSLLLMLGAVGLWVGSYLEIWLFVFWQDQIREAFDTGVGMKLAVMFSFPHWFLTLMFVILPAIWLFKWNRRRKIGPNTCPSCGYDLTGNESGECPECGAIYESPVESA
jgi:hypothetical protein